MIYFIQYGEVGAIKIGFTHDIDNRMKQLQTASPEKLYLLYAMEGVYGDETKLHNKFKEFRKNGEWFRPADCIFNHIIQNAKANHGKIKGSYCLFNSFGDQELLDNLDNNLIQIRIYQEIINQEKVLSFSQEKLLFNKIKTGLLAKQVETAGLETFQYLFSAYLNLLNNIVNIVKEYTNEISVADFELLGVGAVELKNSIEKFAYQCGYNFSIYATQRIIRAIAQEINRCRDDSYSSASDEVMYAIPEEYYENFFKSLVRQEMATMLDPREEIILRSSYFENKTQEEIAEMLGISKGYVGVLKSKAKKKLCASLTDKRKRGLLDINKLFVMKGI